MDHSTCPPALAPLSDLEAEVLVLHFTPETLDLLQHRQNPPAEILALRERALARLAQGLPMTGQATDAVITHAASPKKAHPRYQPGILEELLCPTVRLSVVVNTAIVVAAIFIFVGFATVAVALAR